MKKWLRPTLVGLAGIVAVFALMGEGSDDKASSSETGEKQEASAQKDSTAVGESQAAPAPLGTKVEVAKGWDVTVNSANLDANAVLAAANQFNTPTAGTQFILVNVSITNGTDAPKSTLGEVKLSALPPSGVAIASYSCFAAGVPTLDTTAQMQPGATVTGDICFEVKPEEIATTVLLGEPQFTMDTVEDQRFFALQ